MQVIIYTQTDRDNLGIIVPYNKPVEELVGLVPEGSEYKIVNKSDVFAHPTFLDAITFTNPVTIDMDKAKEITHVHRRASRDKEMKPYDDIIAKQIPGEDAATAEAQRALIRTKYATKQTEIDACTTVEQLQAIIEGMVA